MAKIDWMIKGPWLTTCNCVVGCPCQFNALPSHGHCRAAVGCEVAEGHFGKVKLDGVRFSLNVNNLFDRRYVATCTSLNACYYGTSRVAMATLRYDW